MRRDFNIKHTIQHKRHTTNILYRLDIDDFTFISSDAVQGIGDGPAEKPDDDEDLPPLSRKKVTKYIVLLCKKSFFLFVVMYIYYL